MSEIIFETHWEHLPVTVFETNIALGAAAANEAAAIIQQAIQAKGSANIIIATGNSQLTFLESLRTHNEVEWDKVNIFHMDEYIHLPVGHSASFPLFLKRHFLDFVKVKQFFPVEGGFPDTEQVCAKYQALLHQYPADLCALGIGENGHLAFNDPPYANFNDLVWVKIVGLDERSRLQQVGEGHFPTLDSVPTHAISLTIPALLAAKRVLAIVPEARKADAVYKTRFTPLSEDVPSTILCKTAHAHLFLDRESASKILSL